MGLGVIEVALWGRALRGVVLDRAEGIVGGAEGMVGERDTEVAHLVMVAIRSVRTLL